MFQMALHESRATPHIEYFKEEPSRNTLFIKHKVKNAHENIDPQTLTDFVLENGSVQRLRSGDRVIWTPTSKDNNLKFWVDFGTAPQSVGGDKMTPIGLGAHIHIMRPTNQVHSWWVRVLDKKNNTLMVKEPFTKWAFIEEEIDTQDGPAIARRIRGTDLYFDANCKELFGSNWKLRFEPPQSI